MTPRLKLFQVSCYSTCGTYFQSYLQYVMVSAFDRDEAVSLTEKWLEGSGEKFVLPKKDWVIEELGPVDHPSVLYWHIDSDY